MKWDRDEMAWELLKLFLQRGDSLPAVDAMSYAFGLADSFLAEREQQNRGKAEKGPLAVVTTGADDKGEIYGVLVAGRYSVIETWRSYDKAQCAADIINVDERSRR